MYKLNRKIVKSLNLPGYYNDGFGLYLQVSKSGGKTWIYRYKLHGRRRDMGLGPLSIANHINVAREKAENARALVKSGVDPIDSRSRTQAKQVVEVDARMNFRDVIEKFFQAKDDAGYFRTEQTRRRWYFCLTTHASKLHAMELNDINTRSVYETVLPLWKDKTETASRTRLYLEAVLAWSIALEMREGPNPATWRGNLDQLLTPKERVSPSKNHPSLPWQEVPELMGKLRNLESPASFLTEFIILTASRSGEARGAQWHEMSIDLKEWSITAERMKMKRPHIVPLVGTASELVRNARKKPNTGLVFTNPRNCKPFSYNAPMVTLRKLGYENITTHGFRSSFKTWALEATNFPTQAVEFALAHETKNTVERAYIRGNKMLDKRRDIMREWDAFCSGKSLR